MKKQLMIALLSMVPALGVSRLECVGASEI